MKRIPLDIDYLIGEYLAGKSENALAKELGASRPVIRHRLLENDIRPRSRPEAQKFVWMQRTPEERVAQIAAAHEASVGNPNSFEALCTAAQTRQKRGISISAKEHRLAELLRQRNATFIQQLAIGTYNCDFGMDPVAVEIFGGCWHWYGDHLARTAERFCYIMNAGWHILVITDYGHSGSYPINGAVADYVIAYVEEARRHPSHIREYRVIRGAGELVATGCVDDDEICIIPSFTARRDPITGQYTTIPR